MKPNTYLKAGNAILLITWLILGLVGSESGLEGYGKAMFTALTMMIAIPVALICGVIALVRREKPYWAHVTLWLMAVLPMLR